MDRGDLLEDGARGRQKNGFKVGQDDHRVAGLLIPTNCLPRPLSRSGSEASLAEGNAQTMEENLRLVEAEKAAVCYARAVHILQVSVLCALDDPPCTISSEGEGKEREMGRGVSMNRSTKTETSSLLEFRWFCGESLVSTVALHMRASPS